LARFALLIGLQLVITWLSVRSPAVRRLSKSEPALLFHDGHFLEAAMHRERVVREELLAAIREQGKSSLGEVAEVVLETDGSFSILSSSPQDDARSTLKSVHGARQVGAKG